MPSRWSMYCGPRRRQWRDSVASRAFVGRESEFRRRRDLSGHERAREATLSGFCPQPIGENYR
jgi:hypothetical protein